MRPELRKLLDGTEPVPGFALITFSADTLDPAAPSVMASTRLAAARGMSPRALGEAVWKHLDTHKEQFERELGAGSRFKLEIGGVEIAFMWNVIACGDGDSIFITASMLDEQLAAERALIRMERCLDVIEFLLFGAQRWGRR